MMYPVRTTLLLSVDERTSAKFLRDEAFVESVDKKPTSAGKDLRAFFQNLSHRIGDMIFVGWWRLSQHKPAHHHTH